MSFFFALGLALSTAHAASRFPVVGCEGELRDEFSKRPYWIRSAKTDYRLKYLDTVTNGPRVTLESILAAYRNGLFPWGTIDDNRGKWTNPKCRGVLKFSDLKIPRKDRQYLERNAGSPDLIFTENEKFDQIIAACARNFRYTWLTPEMVAAYTDAFHAGYVIADAVWSPEGELLAAMYGVDVDGTYSGETMIHFRSDVMKPLLYRRIRKLMDQGREFMDVQEAELGLPKDKDFKPSLPVKWGARPIPRREYLRLLRAAQDRHRSLTLGGVL